MTVSSDLKRTPFFEAHKALGGKIVDFAGWEMPVQYSTITQEHNAVRNDVGIFDISHMGQLFVWGKDAEATLQNLVTNDLRKAPAEKGIYAHLLNEKGGVIDDIFVYRLEPEKFLVILNASRANVDIAWMSSHKMGDTQMIEAPYASAVAIQGPKAIDLIGELAEEAFDFKRNDVRETLLGGLDVVLARTGYTGEDGFEIFAPAGHLLQIWPEIFKRGQKWGLRPCGLGARDTLRTEVAYPLYGHELDEDHTPLEAGLSWVVKFDKRQFIGRDALLKQKESGIKQKLFGFKVTSGGVVRPGGSIFIGEKEIGPVASGTFSPTLGVAIGLAYLPAQTSVGQELSIRQGAREMKAVTVTLPFFSKKMTSSSPNVSVGDPENKI